MPRRPVIPKLQRHAATGQGRVRLNGRDHYLGVWPADAHDPPDAVRREYDRRVVEWLRDGRRGPPATAAPAAARHGGVSVNELCLRFLDHAEVYYRDPDGRPTTEVRNYKLVLRRLRHLYGRTPAAAFDAAKLEAFRTSLVAGGMARRPANKDVVRVRSLFKWGALRKVVPASVYHDLLTLPGLEAGRSEARETEPVGPVPDADVQAVLPHLPAVVRAMVELQRASGMRPQEVCLLRPCDLDRSGPVWLYAPPRHKNSWRGKSRVVPLGPRAQAVLGPRLAGAAAGAYLFPPREACAEKMRYVPRQKGRRAPGESYSTNAYGHAVRRACKKAGVAVWSPNRLRHAAATLVRRRFGLEAAQAVLGHARADVSELYAERDLGLAIKVAAELG